MEDQRPVIAAVDGSANGNRALEWAVSQALLAGAPLRIVHARLYASAIGFSLGGPSSDDGVGDDPALIRVRAALEGRSGLPPVTYASHPGAPDLVLPGLGEGARMMVLGSRGRGGLASLLLGSNGLACASRAACPVVVVPRADPPRTAPTARDPYGLVVLGVNGAAPDPGTTAFAFREAARRGARLRVVVARPRPAPAQLHPYRERFPGVDVELVVAPDDAAGRLVAASRAADLLVIGRHRKRPRSRHLSSVTSGVLLRTGCPLAVVPLAQDAVPAAAA
ncbi:universal stress protein [Streptomyces sp. NPDC096339]|uniref:universal stress protein n=1 Tax=Streptomyces sp. NPDC096339 TaxID=3366086 RepID=UPI00382591E9